VIPKKHRLLLAATIAVALGGTSLRAEGPVAPQQPTQQPTTQPAAQDLQSQIEAMRAQLDQLQAKQQEMMHQRESAETEADVLKDADRRSLLIDSDEFTSGFVNNRFTIQSTDGNFVFRPWVHLQVRDSTVYREHTPAGTGQSGYDTQNGIELRRARWGFDGNLFSPDFTYFINWATNRQDATGTVVSSGPTAANPTLPAKGTTIGSVNEFVGGLPELEEAWFQYHFPGTDFSFKGGQMHDPLDHENIIGSKYRDPEASLQGDIMGNVDTFVQAFDVIYDNRNNIRVEGGINDGIRSANTPFEDFPNNAVAYDWGAAARVEYKVFGRWKDYNQFTSLNDKQDLLVIGAGADNSEGGKRDDLSHTVDIQYNMASGLGVYGSYFGRYTRHNTGIAVGGADGAQFNTTVPAKNTYEPTALIQVQYLINGHLEPYARYEYLELKGLPVGAKNDVQEISAGVHYYFRGHNFKFTAQGMYLPNGIPINDTSSDVLANNGHNEFVFIAQFQLLL